MTIDYPEYFNLIEDDISKLSIKSSDYTCQLVDSSRKFYKGFLLAKSEQEKAITLCDINFHVSTDGKYQPRLIFRRVNENFKDKTVPRDSYTQRITFEKGKDGYREFWKMIAFLYRFKSQVDLGEFDDSYKVVDSNAFIYEFKTKEEALQVSELKKLLKESKLSEESIKRVLSDTRKDTLIEFKKLLDDSAYWKAYFENNSVEIKGNGEEAVWHHFLKKHSWILGLNVDIRFVREFLDEVEIGSTNTAGSGGTKIDLLGISDYTVLIELKTPNTNIFTENKGTKARTNTWTFSNSFIEGVSQCLGQKFDWDKNHKNKELINEEKETIDQGLSRTVDPKCIFLIGNKSKEFSEKSKKIDIQIKRDTFERFRRNNRNLEIITFDELYERAYFIVHNEKIQFSVSTLSE